MAPMATMAGAPPDKEVITVAAAHALRDDLLHPTGPPIPVGDLAQYAGASIGLVACPAQPHMPV